MTRAGEHLPRPSIHHSSRGDMTVFGPKRNRPSVQDVTALHRDNLRDNLQRRLEAARARGNDELVRQLEAEADYLK